jgi:dienelactone hydrolase
LVGDLTFTSSRSTGTNAKRALVDEAEDAELFLYAGDQHLFADSSLAAYDADAAGLMRQRVLDFLSTR